MSYQSWSNFVTEQTKNCTGPIITGSNAWGEEITIFIDPTFNEARFLHMDLEEKVYDINNCREILLTAPMDASLTKVVNVSRKLENSIFYNQTTATKGNGLR